ncbi:non-homologous end-joining DNA ligase [Nakamurella lactea]|uniref:non-homologous end-joining DNA ligase n=1 Tax=Nakamurella lactea TaxID=459515 RepID=UPI000417E6D8|nr:non-homologous end-joining DNA ligase [Nakamurella lactea]
MAGESTIVQIDGRRLAVTNLDKVLYPKTGTTKAEVLRYYALVAPALLPVLADRAVTRKRWPNGVDSEPFFVKNTEAGAPRWIPRRTVPHSDGPVTYPLADSAAVLTWMAQMAALELHVPQWRFAGRSADGTCRPDRMVFDLDPGPGVGLVECARVARWVREVLQQAGSDAVPVTSGSKGLHLYVALDGERTSDEVSAIAKAVAQSLEAEHPKLVTSKMAKSVRPDRVFIDWSQNSAAKTTIAPYSMRGRERPMVAAPRDWAELEAADLRHLEFHEVLDRLADGLDPWRDHFGQHDDAGNPGDDGAAADGDLGTPGNDGPAIDGPEADGPAADDAADHRDGADGNEDGTDEPHDPRAGAAAYAVAAMGGGKTHGAHRWQDPLEGPRGRVVRKENSAKATGTPGGAARERTTLSGGGAPELLPMLATAGEPAQITDPTAWRFEGKWDGIRALAAVADGAVRLIGRSGRELTSGYPELAELAELLDGHAAVLDGEIVTLDGNGRTSFPLLQQRMNLASAPAIARAVEQVPVRYFAFDLLQLDGISLLRKTYDQRRRLLEALELVGERVEVPAPLDGDLQEAMRYSRELAWEGIVAKRRDSIYRPGVRSGHWLKMKNQLMQEVVVIGWRPGAGRRAGGIGSLLVAVPDNEGRVAGLRYAGRVGTGFTDKVLDDLQRMLHPAAAPAAAGIPAADARDAVWVEPDLVGEVTFGEWTPDRRLRAASWRGVRTDKSPEDVRLES